MKSECFLNRQGLLEQKEAFGKQKSITQRLHAGIHNSRTFAIDEDDFTLKQLESQVKKLESFFDGMQNVTEAIIQDADSAVRVIHSRIDDSIFEEISLLKKL